MTSPGATQRITRDDLEAKFRELDGEVTESKDKVVSTAIAVGAAVVVVVVAAAFLLGRRKGKLRTTVVEVRRI